MQFEAVFLMAGGYSEGLVVFSKALMSAYTISLGCDIVAHITVHSYSHHGTATFIQKSITQLTDQIAVDNVTFRMIYDLK